MTEKDTVERAAVELKPCPFCGGLPRLSVIGNEHTKQRGIVVRCTRCHVVRRTMAIRHSLDWCQDKAVALWNARALPTAPSGEVERLRQIHDIAISEGAKGWKIRRITELAALRTDKEQEG